ncbi:hypothetical protein [Bradyrhizobium liaoningense]|uniref:hypothetical protein n=1 Tax=Bradyrhizobium liaoningense TaxID=43992 RepID=UPI001BAC43EB|nr:hypothetical protein [Bradyrhizobium liaoningense]MBR0707969.1 hypothetical protein [Bradyrhizobium liaoningense]
MINDRRTFSARSETVHNLRRHLISLAIGGALSLTAFGAYGMESPRAKEATQDAFAAITLPPIPYLDTMPWLKWWPAATMKVDMLMPPAFAPSGIRLGPTPHPVGRPATS